MSKQLYIGACVVAALAGVGLFALNTNIAEHRGESKTQPGIIFPMSDDEPSFEAWGRNFPAQLDGFKAMEHDNLETPYGGSFPFSKIIRYPAAAKFWQGYAFAVDYNKPRTHYYSQIDQVETKRNDKEYLNSHGLPAFKNQPGSCVNCHSGYLMAMMRGKGFEELRQEPVGAASWQMGFFDVRGAEGKEEQKAWTKMNSMKYFDVIAKVKEVHGEGITGSHMGSTCADCHNPDDMSLRVTRPAFVNAMVERGYEADAKHGIKATRHQMRDYVCMQCHVEYYFAKQDSTLVFPWSKWKKDEAFKIEDFDKYYDEKYASGEYPFDYIHKLTKAPIIKMQHPEAEVYSSSLHHRSGVTCADCHMPYVREGANKVSNHNIQTPYADIGASCRSCHPGQSEQQLKDRVAFIQDRHAHELRGCENNLLALIDDIVTARGLLAKQPAFAALEGKAQEDAISKAIWDALWAQRRAHIRWDAAFSENSYGFHSPQESMRTIAQCKEIAREGQTLLNAALSKYGLFVQPTIEAKVPDAPAKITSHKAPTASLPTEAMKATDAISRSLDFK